MCDLALPDGDDKCRNPICNFSDRYFERNHAIAMRSGALEDAIHSYKYDGFKGWATIFARVLVGYLDTNRKQFSKFDLIVASPDFIGEGARRNWSHTALVLERAAQLAPPGDWPFDHGPAPAVIKTAHTEPMVSKTWKQRQTIATGEYRDSLRVPEPAATRGKRVLVYDDIFTDGHTLNEVARALRLHGLAKSVAGITLARQPFKQRG